VIIHKCPAMCSLQGDCDKDRGCLCYGGWQGDDCSIPVERCDMAPTVRGVEPSGRLLTGSTTISITGYCLGNPGDGSSCSDRSHDSGSGVEVGVTSFGITFGGTTTGGTTFGGITTGGLTVGGVIHGGATVDGVTKGGIVVGGVTTGGTTTGGTTTGGTTMGGTTMGGVTFINFGSSIVGGTTIGGTSTGGTTVGGITAGGTTTGGITIGGVTVGNVTTGGFTASGTTRGGITTGGTTKGGSTTGGVTSGGMYTGGSGGSGDSFNCGYGIGAIVFECIVSCPAKVCRQLSNVHVGCSPCVSDQLASRPTASPHFLHGVLARPLHLECVFCSRNLNVYAGCDAGFPISASGDPRLAVSTSGFLHFAGLWQSWVDGCSPAFELHLHSSSLRCWIAVPVRTK
jgi:hypothetical protein